MTAANRLPTSSTTFSIFMPVSLGPAGPRAHPPTGPGTAEARRHSAGFDDAEEVVDGGGDLVVHDDVIEERRGQLHVALGALEPSGDRGGIGVAAGSEPFFEFCEGRRGD